jgi:decaprenyl-phosphate phosphoribosyltransferase
VIGVERATDVVVAPHRPMSTAAGLVRALRPRQWVKNLLVFAAPAAASVLLREHMLVRAVLTFLAFTLASSGSYLINDVLDRDLDRVHPDKMHRPIASGVVPTTLAIPTAFALLSASLLLPATLLGWRTTAVVAAYVALVVGYSLGLKRVAILELFIVSGGFVLRALAGGVADNAPPSEWFLLVVTFGALFIVISKRCAELVSLGDSAAAHRDVLSSYPLPFLRQIRDISASVSLLAYCLWAFARHAGHAHSTWEALSIVPVTLAVFRYALAVERGGGGAPEDLVLRDPTILLSALAWATLFGIGVLSA